MTRIGQSAIMEKNAKEKIGYMKGWICLMLSICLLAGCLGGCTAPTNTETTAGETTVPVTTAEPTEETEPTEPDDGSFKMYYDDHMPIEKLTGAAVTAVEFKDQQVTSTDLQTGEPDAEILRYDPETARLIAVGAGKATVVADGTEYPVTVRPAPISLVMITGHSIGAGQCGVEAQSVLCEEGQAYSTVTADGLSFAHGMGIGSASSLRPAGIDAFNVNGTGTIGEGSALAWRWNQLTGEKIWVMNVAKGGSCINEWISGTDNFNNAFMVFSAAQMILRNEVAAGHYKLRDQAIIYHSAANFEYKSVQYDDPTLETWYSSMCNGFMEGLAADITGDGKEDTLDAIGFAPIWSRDGVGKYPVDKPANFYMAASAQYPRMFMTANTLRQWIVDINKFPAIEYTTHGQEVTRPLMNGDLYATDGVHLSQVAYNALGLGVAEELYGFLRQKERATQIKLVDEFGTRIQDKVQLRKGATKSIVISLEDGNAADLTFTVSDNLKLSFPLVVTAVSEGEGTLTVSKGNTVLKTITFTVD